MERIRIKKKKAAHLASPAEKRLLETRDIESLGTA